ncbi:Phosducin-like protein 3,Viral IAP-associated factor homolog [Lepeophtheirus salmonis]|uniref:Phosducin-like protein 3,Viral IAP-associated factor homolog n=1 Tax=Lepeophtheirus salmonis TaxID=72036 RepID=A0A7R8CR79_LEPSM|nr:Phosducin-like protein 3,Viral IAP-associated factor homolog [Lepeophtheirus salmonis]CAF2868378.1 Phosducin-like protein 3,Viral IAP-associated factor homolog [Lepeophtheirus salmonis]
MGETSFKIRKGNTNSFCKISGSSLRVVESDRLKISEILYIPALISNSSGQNGTKYKYPELGRLYEGLTVDALGCGIGFEYMEDEYCLRPFSPAELNIMDSSLGISIKMQDPNEDTEWNDILRQKGIIPKQSKEKEITEEDIVALVDKTAQSKINGKTIEEMNLDELDELEDEEEERVLEIYRRQRIAEMTERMNKSKYGDVREISANDYVQQVNEAGEGVYVVLHLYKAGIPLCALLNKYMNAMAAKFPAVKFLKREMKTQIVGPMEFRGMNCTEAEFEFILGRTGAISTTITKDPQTCC